MLWVLERNVLVSEMFLLSTQSILLVENTENIILLFFLCVGGGGRVRVILFK